MFLLLCLNLESNYFDNNLMISDLSQVLPIVLEVLFQDHHFFLLKFLFFNLIHIFRSKKFDLFKRIIFLLHLIHLLAYQSFYLFSLSLFLLIRLILKILFFVDQIKFSNHLDFPNYFNLSILLF